mgnify:CR=1 FL=1
MFLLRFFEFDAIFSAIWVESKNMGDLDIVAEVLTDANLNTWIGTWEAGLNINFYQ